MVNRTERDDLKRKRQKVGPDEGKMLITVAAVQMDTSTRKIQRQHSISQSTASRILRNYKLHPYHITFIQALKNEDFIRHVRFCNWAENQIKSRSVIISLCAFFLMKLHLIRVETLTDITVIIILKEIHIDRMTNGNGLLMCGPI